MKDKKTPAEFAASLDRRLSGLQGDPWLARRIMARETGEDGHRRAFSRPIQKQGGKTVKKKLSYSVTGFIAVLIGLTAAAMAAATFYRVITWQGEVSRTADPSETPEHFAKENADAQELREKLISFLWDIPDEETAFAWYEDEGEITASELHQKQKTFASTEDFRQFMAGAPYVTVPIRFPEEQIKACSATVYMGCKANGKYDLLKNNQNSSMRYRRFLIDDASAIITGYDLILTLEDGSAISVSSQLRSTSSSSAEPLMLREGESAERIPLPGMTDALLIKARDPAYPDGLIMRRTLEEPVQWKMLPYNDHVTSDDNNFYYEEYISVWGHGLRTPELLISLFSAQEPTQ